MTTHRISRRRLLRDAGTAAGALALGAAAGRADQPVATRGRVKQSLVQW